MDKNYLQDVVPPAQKRSIRDIPVPNRDKKNPDIRHEPKQQEPNREEPDLEVEDNSFDNFDEEPPKKKKKKSKKFWIILSIIFVTIVTFLIFSSFDKATVSVIPKKETTSFEEEILIEDLSKKESSDSLGYRIIELSQQESEVAEAIDEEPVEEKASGEIIVYNEYSEDPQRLIGNTRFESSDGRIYRIDDSISVPGYTESSDGSKTPGQITVTVYADEIGEEYNLSSGEFTIPGFEGQEPYDFFYAKTSTPINGGFDGVRKIVSEENIENITQQLQSELREKLINELDNEITDEFYISYNDDSFVYNEIEQNPIQNSENVQLTMRASVTAKIFNKVDMSNSLADKLFSNYLADENTLINNFDSLNIETKKGSQDEETDGDSEEGEEESEENNQSNQEHLVVSGENIEFIWQIDNEQLKKDLIGEEVDSLSSIMKNYSEVKNAEAKVKPFWKSEYPTDKDDIEIEIVN